MNCEQIKLCISQFLSESNMFIFSLFSYMLSTLMQYHHRLLWNELLRLIHTEQKRKFSLMFRFRLVWICPYGTKMASHVHLPDETVKFTVNWCCASLETILLGSLKVWRSISPLSVTWLNFGHCCDRYWKRHHWGINGKLCAAFDHSLGIFKILWHFYLY